MKQFKSLQELWAYCMYCPLCKEMCRNVIPSIGPDDNFFLKTYRKTGRVLLLKNKYSFINEYGNNINNSLNLSIDCETHTVSQNLFDMGSGEIFYKEINGYIYFIASCNMCDSVIFSKEISFNNHIINVPEIQIESETYLLNNELEEFHISLHHDFNHMDILRKDIDNHENEYKKPITCELFDLDFNNIEKTLKRLKTIVVFS